MSLLRRRGNTDHAEAVQERFTGDSKMTRKISYPGLLLGLLTGLLVGLVASHLMGWFLLMMVVALVVLGWRMRRPKAQKRKFFARAA
jgi:hypothetical protein